MAADVDALAMISARSWEATYRGTIPDAALDEWIGTTHQAWREAFVQRQADGPTRSWVAEREQAILGYATTAPARDNWLPPPAGAGGLTNLYVDPDVMGTGVGRLLYEHAIDDLRERGFDPSVVCAFRDNHRARRFDEARRLTIDVPDHAWILADVPCPIVRFRDDLARAEGL